VKFRPGSPVWARAAAELIGHSVCGRSRYATTRRGNAVTAFPVVMRPLAPTVPSELLFSPERQAQWSSLYEKGVARPLSVGDWEARRKARRRSSRASKEAKLLPAQTLCAEDELERVAAWLRTVRSYLHSAEQDGVNHRSSSMPTRQTTFFDALAAR